MLSATNSRAFTKAPSLSFKTAHETVSSLLNLVGTPSNFPTNVELIENVWVCFSGNERKAEKVRELNLMLINWVGNRRLKKAANKISPHPQPATLNMDLRAFFVGTKEYYL